MKLLLKFNLVFLLVFCIGLAATAYISRSLLQQGALEEVLESARFLMEKAIAIRTYTATQVAPLLRNQSEQSFLPQTVPAYSATEVINELRKKHPEYNYKEATLNPTNPRDRAVEWEADLVTQFRNDPDLKEFVGQREIPSGRNLYVARPIRITNPACLACHTTASAAPASMIAKYGPANGFGWTLNEAVGAQVVSVPMDVPFQRADKAFWVFITMIVSVFAAIGIALNLLMWFLVIRPVSKLSALADRVSLGDLAAPEFAVGGRDEISTLAESFGRMRKSLAQAMKMLES